MKLREGDHIPLTVLLHIFSYQHNSLRNIISKQLSKYGKEDYDFNKTKLPVTLILSSDLLMEIFKDVLVKKNEENSRKP